MAAVFVADYLGPEYDRPPASPPTGPRRTYVVCSTPRSGSGLLCRALAGSGALGTPLEYLNSIHRGILSERWGCGADLRSYVAALHARRTSIEGLFGVKVHWEQLVATRAEAGSGVADPAMFEVRDALVDDLFPNPLFVRILRMDVDAQAVSLWRALQSNVWSLDVNDATNPEDVHIPYSFDGIDQCRRSIEVGEVCWERLLLRLRAVPYVVTYEQLTSTFSETVASLAGHLRPGSDIEIVLPRTRRLADEWSRRLVDRFRSERADRS
jgi:LPS sulfotransferase NodH